MHSHLLHPSRQYHWLPLQAILPTTPPPLGVCVASPCPYVLQTMTEQLQVTLLVQFGWLKAGSLVKTLEGCASALVASACLEFPPVTSAAPFVSDVQWGEAVEGWGVRSMCCIKSSACALWFLAIPRWINLHASVRNSTKTAACTV